MRPIIFVFFFTFLFSCSVREVSENELVEYIKDPDHGLTKRSEIKDGFVEVIYKPTDLIITQNYKEDISKKGKIDSLRKSLSKFHYFTIRISKGGKEIETHFIPNQAVYQEVVQYMSYYMQENIFLKVKAGSYPPTDYHYMGMFGTTEASTILIAFANTLIQDGNFFIHFDGAKLGVGTHDFNFKREDLTNTPTINL